jgi:diguanylate cyclase (GGDEF)-like protein
MRAKVSAVDHPIEERPSRRDRQIAARRRGVLLVLLAACLGVSIGLGSPPVWALFLVPLLLAVTQLYERGAALTTAAAAIACVVRLQVADGITPAGLRDGLIAVALFGGFGLALGRLLRRQRRREGALEAGTLNDRLTGLYNYGSFADLLFRETSRVQRYGGRLTLVMLDLDRFKRFNDRFGHEAGNLLLRRFGETLRGLVRDADIAARYGGEEFAVLIRGDELDGMRLAERIRTAVLTMRIMVDGEEAYVSASAGVACLPDDAATQEELVEHADAALYASKQAGRNLVTGYTLGLGRRRKERRLRAVANG